MKIFATDYDGTLRMGSGISEDNMNAIKEFRRNGNLFGVVTGRDYENGYKVFKELNEFPFDYLILSNGACAYDFDGNELFCTRTDSNARIEGKNLATALVKKCLDLNVEYCGLYDGKTRYIFCSEFPSGGEIDGMTCSSLSVLDDIDSFISGFAVFENDDVCAPMWQKVRDLFCGHIEVFRNGRSLDFTPKGVSKATGIQVLADRFGVKKEDIYSAGDNLNDISMLKEYHGCAMASGVKEAQDCAEFVCESVAKAIEIALKN